jgi:hypothetical protein
MSRALGLSQMIYFVCSYVFYEQIPDKINLGGGASDFFSFENMQVTCIYNKM